MNEDDDEDEEGEYDTTWGVRIGKNMKGALLDGDVLGWSVNGKTGWPHHEDVDPDGRRYIQFAYIGKNMSIDGSAPPISFLSDILGYFVDYENDTNIDVNLGVLRSDEDFNFTGTVGQLKTFFRAHPPPNSEDYDDGIDDVDFVTDYVNWSWLPHQKKTAREILGRGGRDDSWQEKDEDFSKSFSVYNNPKKRKREK